LFHQGVLMPSKQFMLGLGGQFKFTSAISSTCGLMLMAILKGGKMD
jgi:hypothetical protein